MDITIAQFKKHYVAVCIIISFSIYGIFWSYHKFLSGFIFPVTSIENAYNAAFLLFFAIGVTLPQWLLKAVLFSEHLRQPDMNAHVPSLPSGRADLQNVTLVMSGVIMILSLLMVIVVFCQDTFAGIRDSIYKHFYLSSCYPVCDTLLVFAFSGIIWTLVGILCVMLYRMVLSLTTQTGVYQTLEQRFYMLIFGGVIAGMFIWPLLFQLLGNVKLVMLLTLVPLAFSAFWLPAVFSRSAERSYLKHFELKTGVLERSYISKNSAGLLVLGGAILLGGHYPVITYFESLACFPLGRLSISPALPALCILAGWYYGFKRELSGRQYKNGAIIPLYRWAAASLATIFLLALIFRRHMNTNLFMLALWYSSCGISLFFIGDLLFCLRLIIAGAVASMFLGWVMWVLMMCLGCLAGLVIFAHFCLESYGSLMTVIILFYSALIVTGLVVIFTSPQEKWLRQVLMYCLLPIFCSTFIIFWVSHNWLLPKQYGVAGYSESLNGTWKIVRFEDHRCWFSQVNARTILDQEDLSNAWSGQLNEMFAQRYIKKAFLAGSIVGDVSHLPLQISKDILVDSHILKAGEFCIYKSDRDFGVSDICVDVQQLLMDKWKKYDLIWLDGNRLFDQTLSRNYSFWYKLIDHLNNNGMLVIAGTDDPDSAPVKSLSATMSVIAGLCNADLSVITQDSPDFPSSSCTIFTLIKKTKNDGPMAIEILQ